MKIFISADIEGSAGIARWEEARPENPSYGYFQKQMSAEVAAACKGAFSAGADNVFVKDAHGPACNIIPSMLPVNAKLIRGWGMSPLLMMEGLDESFDAVVFTGYHSAAGENGNPLAHTISSSQVENIKINGQICSEFILNTYTAAYFGVPVCFISGDRQLCEKAKKLIPEILTMYTIEGFGGSTISIHPDKAVEFIEAGVAMAVKNLGSQQPISLPNEFEVEIRFKEHPKAYKASFYPHAHAIDEKTVAYGTNDYMNVLRFLLFTIM